MSEAPGYDWWPPVSDEEAAAEAAWEAQEQVLAGLRAADDLAGAGVYDLGFDVPEEVWVRGMPSQARADYLTGAYTGEDELFGCGFTHHDGGVPSGRGFAAGGVNDTSPPGPGLYSALAAVTAGGCDALGESERIGVMCAYARTEAQVQAGKAKAVASLVRRRTEQSARPGMAYLVEHVAEEVAAALGLTLQAANRLITLCLAVVDRLPMLCAALEEGRIDWARACVYADELACLPDELAREICARLLAGMAGATTGALRTRLRREVYNADPEAAEARKREARKDARIDVWSEPSGNACLASREMSRADAIASRNQVMAAARWLRDRGTEGSLGEIATRVLAARLTCRDITTLLPDGEPGSEHDDAADTAPGDSTPGDSTPGTDDEHGDSAAGSGGEPQQDSGAPRGGGGDGPSDGSGGLAGPCGCGAGGGLAGLGGTVNLTFPLTSWAGLVRRAGQVAGYGPADADDCIGLARQAGPAARWCMTLTDQDGRAVAHACAPRGDAPAPGATALRWAAGLREKLQFLETSPCSHARQSGSYRPPPSLRHLIQTRQPTCSAPGCRQPATVTDLDHTIPFDQGGRTCECNLSPLCRRHHRCKQAPQWRVTHDPPGHLTWTTPSGRTYHTEPESYPI